MRSSLLVLSATLSFLGGRHASAQMDPHTQWTLLPEAVMDEIIGEASGETAWNTIMETGGYNRDRLAAEYEGTFFEAQYIYDQMVHYGLPGAEIARYPGGRTWDGVVGELWETRPRRQKLASYRDQTVSLARGSSSTDVEAELVWVGSGSQEEIEQAEVEGRIVVTDGSLGRVHQTACLEGGAVGVVAIGNSRPLFDPLQLPWSSVRGRRGGDQPARFGFLLSPREGADLERRLRSGEKITAHARVVSKEYEYDLEDPTCHIPGTDPEAGEVILSAHLFEGYTKQGANDNLSGSAAILEVARVLHALIEEGRIPRPKRTIRFLWGPEFSGTGPWVRDHKELMAKTLCNINLDMVGEWLSLNLSFMCLMRTTYGHAHYINDVMENYYRFVGESSRERIQARRGGGASRRIVAPTGAVEPFYYSIETHYGASDHEVFNDWGVGVPGVMMIVWPDRWYHTSGDRVDKADPTQLKRVVVIAAAGAYTIAQADDDMAVKIASEIASNGTRRLGHQLVLGLEKLNGARADVLADAYQAARTLVEAAVLNEIATLASVLELAENHPRLERHLDTLQRAVARIGESHLAVLDAHMAETARRLGAEPVALVLGDLEKRAAKIVPRPTVRVTENGYREWRNLVSQVPAEESEKFPYGRRDIADTSELCRLINGHHSALDIKRLLDAQSSRPSDLQAILNYLAVLELAGLVEKAAAEGAVE